MGDAASSFQIQCGMRHALVAKYFRNIHLDCIFEFRQVQAFVVIHVHDVKQLSDILFCHENVQGF
jgi:hypothetical protein